MYVTKQQAEALKEKFISSVSDKMLETNSFMAKLAEEDDWSFVIKSHALIEAAVTNLIVSVLGDSRIQPSIERLPLSDAQQGKIAFAKQLGVLDANQRKFIRWFSELRNRLVHKVENVNFKFEAHWKELDNQQKKAWRQAIDWVPDKSSPNEGMNTLIEKNTKIALWISITVLVGTLEGHAAQALTQRTLNSDAEATTKEHIDSQSKLIKLQDDLIKELSQIITDFT